MRRWLTWNSLFHWRDLSCTLAPQPPTTDWPQGVPTPLSFSPFCGIYFSHENSFLNLLYRVLFFTRFASGPYCILFSAPRPDPNLILQSIAFEQSRVHCLLRERARLVLPSVFPQTPLWFRHVSITVQIICNCRPKFLLNTNLHAPGESDIWPLWEHVLGCGQKHDGPVL